MDVADLPEKLHQMTFADLDATRRPPAAPQPDRADAAESPQQGRGIGIELGEAGVNLNEVGELAGART